MTKRALCFISLFFLVMSQSNSAENDDVYELMSELDIQPAAKAIRNSAGWKKPQKVVIFLPNNRIPKRADYRTWLQKAAGSAELVFVKTPEELELEKEDTDVYLGFCHHVTADMEKLRWVQNYFVGIDRCVNNEVLLENNILLTNTRAIPGPGMAEHTMTLVLMLARKMPYYYKHQLKSKWRRLPNANNQVMELNGKTILVVGLGGIGKQIAKRAHAFGMRVYGIRNRSRSGPDYVEYVGLSDELKEMAKKADVVVNITPLTKATTGLFDRDFFKAMKSTAFFINIGRGKSVVTNDLIIALKEKEIAGAGLDVTDPEPLPADNPLWQMDNVIITPHNSAPSDQMMQRFWLLVRENLRRYTMGEPMLNVVDIKRGY